MGFFDIIMALIVGGIDFVVDRVSKLFGSGSDGATPDKEDKSTSYIVFGEKGSGKHEFMAMMANVRGHLKGTPHSKDFEGVYQRSFFTSTKKSFSNDQFLLLGLDTKNPQRLLKNAQAYLADAFEHGNNTNLDVIFLVNLKQFIFDGDLTLRNLFAQYLFLWRAALEYCSTATCGSGQYKCAFDPQYSDCADDLFLFCNWGSISLVGTHLDDIPEANRESVKKLFLQSYAKMKGEALISSFGSMFAQMFKETTITPAFVDLFNVKKRNEAYATIYPTLRDIHRKKAFLRNAGVDDNGIPIEL